VGLVRELVGRLFVFVLVSLTFCLGLSLGLLRAELPAEPSGEIEGIDGTEVWGSLWDAAAAAAPLAVAAAAVPEDTEEAEEVASVPANDAAAEAGHVDEGGTKAAAGDGSANEAVGISGERAPSPDVAEVTTKQGTGKGRARGKKCVEEPGADIVATAENKWTVQRDLLQSYTRNFARLDSLGWSKRHDGADGKADGMLIGGVKCNSDLHRAGIRSGDVVHSVNGRGVTSFVDAFFVYTKVRNDPVVRVEITRRGQRKLLVYRLVG
jgi:hypothetical protein